MNYKIDYKAKNKIDAFDLGTTTLECAIGARFDAFIENRISGRFAIKEILGEAERAFVYKLDDEYGYGLWLGEFWGKQVLGACRVARCKRDSDLAEEIRASVYRVLDSQEENGSLNTYYDDAAVFGVSREETRRMFGNISSFNWNIWCRKYTLWALIEAAMLLDDEKILTTCCKIADHLIDQLAGLGVRVKDTGSMSGMPSCSIMKPMLVLYRLTAKEKYLDFCKDIIKEWKREDDEAPNLLLSPFKGCPPQRWFAPAVDGELYGVGWRTKAYEMMSCFDGILEYYRITGESLCLEASERFYDVLMKYELNILGSVGYGEYFVNGASYPDATTELCDVIHWMRLCYELFALTGNAKYMDSFENAFMNAFLAGVYSDGYRGGMFIRSSGRHRTGTPQCKTKYQHCCTNNAARGFANACEAAVMADDSGYYINLYASVISKIGQTVIHMDDGYNGSGKVVITVRNSEIGKKLFLRIPEWSENTTILANGKEMRAESGGYFAIELDRRKTIVRIEFDMTPRIEDFAGEFVDLPDSDYHVSRWCDGNGGRCDREQMCKHPMATIRRGALLLARSKKLGCSGEDMFSGETVFGKKREVVARNIQNDDMLSIVNVNITADGKELNYTMCDFASASNVETHDVHYFTVFI